MGELKNIVNSIVSGKQKIREMARISTKYKAADGVETSAFGKIANRVLDALKAQPEGLTQQEIAKELNYPIHQHINPYMRKMFDAGEIEKIGLSKPIGYSKMKPAEPEEEEPEVEYEYKPEPKYFHYSTVETEPEEDEEEKDVKDDWDTIDTGDDFEDDADLDKKVSVGKKDKELGQSKDTLATLIKKKDALIADLKAKRITLDDYKKQIGDIPEKIKKLQAKFKDDEDDDILFEGQGPAEIDNYSRMRFLANLR